MKVGILLWYASSEAGGGFTLEDELLEALVECSGESRHSFVVFGHSKSWETEARHIQFVSLDRRLPGRILSRIRELGRGLSRKIRHPNRPFWAAGTVERIVLRSGIDILWCPNQYYATLELPCLLTVLDLQHRLQPYFPEVSVNREWDMREQSFSMALRRAAAVITGSEVGKAEIERFYQVPSERIRVLPMPTPHFATEVSSEDSARVLAKYDVPGNHLFYPAQFWPHKNHAGLLRAVRLLRDVHGLEFPVVFAGSDKGNRSYIEELVADLGLSSVVHFLGFVPRQDLIALYQSAFALVFPTFFGPDNLPPLEAFALGCPVIASDVAGAREQLGDAALLFDPRSPEEMALAIKSLQDDPDLRLQLQQRGLARAGRRTGRDYVGDVLALLDEFEPIRGCWSH